MAERHARWMAEAEADLDARTKAFYDAYEPQHYTFTRGKRGKLVARRVEAPMPDVMARGAPGGKVLDGFEV